MGRAQPLLRETRDMRPEPHIVKVSKTIEKTVTYFYMILKRIFEYPHSVVKLRLKRPARVRKPRKVGPFQNHRERNAAA